MCDGWDTCSASMWGNLHTVNTSKMPRYTTRISHYLATRTSATTCIDANVNVIISVVTNIIIIVIINHQHHQPPTQSTSPPSSSPSIQSTLFLILFIIITYTFEPNSLEVLPLAIFWTSRHHRCPTFPPGTCLHPFSRIGFRIPTAIDFYRM